MLLMATADTGIAGFLVVGVRGVLGPFCLAGLLDEKTGIWLTHKAARTPQLPHAVATCR